MPSKRRRRRQSGSHGSDRPLRIESLEDRRMMYATYFDQGDTQAILPLVGSRVVTYSYSNLLSISDPGLNTLSTQAKKDAIQEAMGIWAGTSTFFFEERPDSGPAVSDAAYAAGGTPIIRWGAHTFAESPGGFHADSVFHAGRPGPSGHNSDIHFATNRFLSGVNYNAFLTSATQAVGHAIGLAHATGDTFTVGGFEACPPYSDAIMNACVMDDVLGIYPFQGLGSTYLTDDDRNGAAWLYGAGMGYVLNSAGELHIYGTRNNDFLRINVSGGVISATNTEISGWGQRGFTRSTAGVTGIFLHGQNGDDTFRIEANDAHLPIRAFGNAGNDTFDVQFETNRNLDLATANVTFEGGAGFDRTYLYDDNANVNAVWSIFDDRVVRVHGQYDFNLRYGSDLELLDVRTSNFAQYIGVNSTNPVTDLTVHTRNGTSTIIVGGGLLSGIRGDVTLIQQGQGLLSGDNVVIDDSASITGRSVVFGGDATFATLTGPGLGTISWQNAGVDSVEYRPGSGADAISLDRANEPTSIAGSAVGSNDVVSLFVPGLSADVYIAGSPTITAYDNYPSSTVGKVVYLEHDSGSGYRLAGLTPAYVGFATPSSLALFLGSGDDGFVASGSQPFPIFVDAGPGGDTLHLSAWSNFGGGRPFQYDGGLGNDVAWLSDEGRGGEFNYSLADDLITGNAPGLSLGDPSSLSLYLPHVEQHAIGMSDARNVVDVRATESGYTGTFSGGAFLSLNGGDDEVIVHPRLDDVFAGATQLTGDIVIDGPGAGFDKLTIDASNQSVGDNWTVTSGSDGFVRYQAFGLPTIRTRPIELAEIKGSQGSDVFTVLSYGNNGSLFLRGNGGADGFGVGSDFQQLEGSYIRLDGGAGSDYAQVSSINSTLPWTIIQVGGAVVPGTDSIWRAFSGGVLFDFANHDVESMGILGGQGDDDFYVRYAPAGKSLGLHGWDGSDRFFFGRISENLTDPNLSPAAILGPVTISNSSGPEIIAIDNSAAPTPMVVHIDEQAVGRTTGDNLFGPGGSLGIEGLDGSLTLTGTALGNTVSARPSPALAVNVVAPTPPAPGPSGAAPPPGENSLLLGLAGIANPSFASTGPNSGIYNFANASPITYNGFSTPAVDATPPQVVSQRFDASAGYQFRATFDQDVATIAPSGVFFPNSSTAFHLQPDAYAYNAALRQATFYFVQLPGGRPPVGVYTTSYTASIRDYAGNPVAAPATPYVFEIASALAGDYDLSGFVDGGDVLAWQRQLGATATPSGHGADGDVSGVVDAVDLAIIGSNFGASAAAASAASAVAAGAASDQAALDAAFGAGDLNPATVPLRSYRPRRRGA